MHDEFCTTGRRGDDSDTIAFVFALNFTKRTRIMPGVKRCSRCKQEKGESAFQKNGSTGDGLQD